MGVDRNGGLSGRGLWSTLYGYLALDADKNHVRGITFYEHGETPGLGDQIDRADWLSQWPGKRVFDDGCYIPERTLVEIGDFADLAVESCEPQSVDRVVLDMLAPWENLEAAATVLAPGYTGAAGVLRMMKAAGDTMSAQPSWEQMIEDGGFLDEADLIEEGEVLDGSDLLEEVDEEEEETHHLQHQLLVSRVVWEQEGEDGEVEDRQGRVRLHAPLILGS